MFGQFDQNLAKLERRLRIVAASPTAITSRLKGDVDACEHARRALEILYGRVQLGQDIGLGDVDGAVEESTRQRSLFPDAETGRGPFEQIGTRKRGPVRARNLAQDLYLRALKRHELVFAEGPAGTARPGSRSVMRCLCWSRAWWSA